jgi:hypothetical protein
MTGYSKVISYVVVGAVVLVLAFMFVVMPALGQVEDLAEQERATRTEILRLDQQILAYRTAQTELARAEGKDLLFSSVVDDKKLYYAIELVEEAARSTGSTHELKILRESLAPTANVSASLDKITEQTALEEVPYMLTVMNASYSQLVDFFRYLENIPYFTEIGSFNASVEQTEFGGRIVVTINGVFVVKPYAP